MFSFSKALPERFHSYSFGSVILFYLFQMVDFSRRGTCKYISLISPSQVSKVDNDVLCQRREGEGATTDAHAGAVLLALAQDLELRGYFIHFLVCG